MFATLAIGAAAAFSQDGGARPACGFPVQPGEALRLAFALPGDAPATTAEVRFFDETGKDTAEIERALGFAESTVRAPFPAGGGDFEMTCQAPQTIGVAPVRGELRFDPPVAAQAFRVLRGTTLGADEGGIDETLVAEGTYALNLVPNPSFEELEGGLPKGWRYVGEGPARVTRNAFAGNYALSLTSENEKGRWESDPMPLAGADPVHWIYSIKFSRHARPHGHLAPVRIEFLRMREDGGFDVFPLKEREEFGYWHFGTELYGTWFTAVQRAYDPPQGATHVRAFAEFRNTARIWRGDVQANWEEIRIDNVAVWQQPRRAPTARSLCTPYGHILAVEGSGRPPLLPAGMNHENTAWCATARTPDGNLVFQEDNRDPIAVIHVVNLLGYRRSLEIKGTVEDAEGKLLGELSQSIELAPWEPGDVQVKMPPLMRFGMYVVRYGIFDAGRRISGGVTRVGYLARRPRLTPEERLSPANPFGIHPRNWDLNRSPTPANLEEIERQCLLMETIGASGARIQSRYTGLDLADGAATESWLGETLENWNEKIEPILKRHHIRPWVSLMEQGRNNLPRWPQTDDEFAVWRRYHEMFAAGMSDFVGYVVFGNEGIGGHTAHLKPDDDAFATSALCTTTRHWMKCAGEAVGAMKRANPGLKVGISHASDENGCVERLYKELPEGGFPVDVFGMNHYNEPFDGLRKAAEVLGPDLVADTFAVLPECGMGTKYDPASERRKAEFVPQLYTGMSADVPWVRYMPWFTLMEGGWEGHGLFMENFAPRAAAVAYAVMTDTLGPGRVEWQMRFPSGGRFVLWRRTNGRVIGFGFSEGGESVPLATGAETYTTTDVFGNASEHASPGARADVKLGGNGLYVLAPDLKYAPRYTFSGHLEDDGIAIDLENRTDHPLPLSVTVKAHALLSVEGSAFPIELEPHGTVRKRLPVTLRKRMPGLRYAVSIEVRDAAGNLSSFAFADAFENLRPGEPPRDLVVNGTLEDWDDAGRPVGWSPRFDPQPGIPDPDCCRFEDIGGAIRIARTGPCLFASVDQEAGTLPARGRFYFSVRQIVDDTCVSGCWANPVIALRDTVTGAERLVSAPATKDYSGPGAFHQCEFTTGPNPEEATIQLRQQGPHDRAANIYTAPQLLQIHP